MANRRRTKAVKSLLDAARKTQVADKPNKVVTLGVDKVPMSKTQRRVKKAVNIAVKEDAAKAAVRAKKKAEAASKKAAATKQANRSKTMDKVGKGAAGVGTAALASSLLGKKGGSYSIKSGDTLSQIAKKQGTTLKALLAANPGIKDPNKIRVGQKIKLGSPVKNRKSVYQGMTKKQMSDMAMPKKKGGKVAPSEKIPSRKPPASEKEAMERAMKRIKKSSASRKESIKRMGGGKVMSGSQLVASLYD